MVPADIRSTQLPGLGSASYQRAKHGGSPLLPVLLTLRAQTSRCSSKPLAMAKIPRVTLRTSLLAWAAITLAFAWTGSRPWLIFSAAEVSEPSPVEFVRKKDNPFVDAVAGTICAGIAFSLLWLNEGHAVKIEQLLDLVRRRVREIGTSALPENERHLVFLNGDARTTDQLVLPEWGGVSAPANSAKLRAQLAYFVPASQVSKCCFLIQACTVLTCI